MLIEFELRQLILSIKYIYKHVQLNVKGKWIYLEKKNIRKNAKITKLFISYTDIQDRTGILWYENGKNIWFPDFAFGKPFSFHMLKLNKTSAIENSY